MSLQLLTCRQVDSFCSRREVLHETTKQKASSWATPLAAQTTHSKPFLAALHNGALEFSIFTGSKMLSNVFRVSSFRSQRGADCAERSASAQLGGILCLHVDLRWPVAVRRARNRWDQPRHAIGYTKRTTAVHAFSLESHRISTKKSDYPGLDSWSCAGVVNVKLKILIRPEWETYARHDFRVCHSAHNFQVLTPVLTPVAATCESRARSRFKCCIHCFSSG
eukprot:6193124-Pleurochrysis_carterae.AAC.3